MRWRPAVLATSLLSLLCVLVTPAHATFPGKNGKIAITSYEGSGPVIRVMDPDGSNVARVGEISSVDPAWSPDGTKIAFNSGNVETLKLMNADGSGITTLTSETANHSPAWSPDGTKIAFASIRDGDYDIWVIRPDGTGLAQLTNEPERRVDNAPSWSPDGSKIAFATNRDGPYEVYVMNADGTGQQALIGGYSANWSPDGRKIAITDLSGNVSVVNSDGTDPVRLTAGPPADGFDPVWSPDGTKIAFISGRDPPTTAPNRFELYVMNADGTNQTRLTDNVFNYIVAPDWQTIPGPNRGDYKNAAQFCRAEREFLGEEAFRQKYGGGADAYGKCVSSE